METDPINISILEDHPPIIDSYRLRLAVEPRIHISGVVHFGDELEPMLAAFPTDILIMDVEVPTSLKNPNPFAILNIIPKLTRRYPKMAILIISGHTQQVLVERMFELGVRGFIFKNDHNAFDRLAAIAVDIYNGIFFFSLGGHEKLRSLRSDGSPLLSQRQLEALSLCVAFPDSSTSELAHRMSVSDSTFRNLLSAAYKHLKVRTRQAAIAELQRMGIGSSDFNPEMTLNP